MGTGPDAHIDRAEPSERVLRTGLRQRGAWASRGAKVLLVCTLAAWLGLAAYAWHLGFRPRRGGVLLYAVTLVGVLDGLRRTLVESWHAVPGWVRWVFLALVGLTGGLLLSRL